MEPVCSDEEAFAKGVQVGIAVSMIIAVVALIVRDCMRCVLGWSPVWLPFGGRRSTLVVSTCGGDLNSSVTQTDGRVWIDGVEVTEAGTQRPYTDVVSTRALRITADGRVLGTQLQPGQSLTLRFESGARPGTITVGTSCDIHAQTLHCDGNVAAGTSIHVIGNVTAKTIDAGTSIDVTGNATADKFDAGTSMRVDGQTRRRRRQSKT